MRDHDFCTLTLAHAHARRLCKTHHAHGAVQDYDAPRPSDLCAAHDTSLAPDSGTKAPTEPVKASLGSVRRGPARLDAPAWAAVSTGDRSGGARA